MVGKIIRAARHDDGPDREPRPVGLTDPVVLRQQARNRVAQRCARYEAEVSAHANDPRVRRLRELTLLLPKGSRNAALKAEQADLVAALWADDPRFWTTERLAIAIGHKGSASVYRILQRAQHQDDAARTLGVLPNGRTGTGRTRPARRAA
jgi:hypothetical protein